MDWLLTAWVCLAWVIGFSIGSYGMHRKGMKDMAQHIVTHYNVTPKQTKDED